MKRLKVLLVLSLVVVGLVISGIVIQRVLQSKRYTKVRPQTGEVTEAVYGLGKVKSNRRYEVKLGVISTVRELYVNEGDVVKAGQNLVRIDSNVVFKAPFDGTVTMINNFEGETALPQSVILRMEDLKDRFIELSVEQEGALRVQKGQMARVSFESLRGEVLVGKVKAIFPKGDEFIADVEISNLGASILPGMTADVSIEIGKIKGTLVPLKALRNGTLSVERDGHIQKIKVEVGLVDGLSAEIKSGDLMPTDEILVPKE
ncbi:efflux RND transporter periplasmic adaptor subunit [Bdellovibrio sp. ArHS]|uniref:efflux RND transporter periplasmic adaptor subunit n=1 Tax=Bdellovibrio sp. ArHS TaxID=1569284 RepID=UPI0025BA903F|nr:efflux RND transporter periplasmic adaptor subunit [Bdellovibrio sp. ArHS]